MIEMTTMADRVRGVLVGAAVGDALGVPYEFQKSMGPDGQPEMIGGGLGPYAPGEYSDDTQMQVVVAQVAAVSGDVSAPAALDAIANGFIYWRRHGASDIGAQTAAVIGSTTWLARRLGVPAGTAMRIAADDLHRRHGRSGGNGSLMRTGVVALRYLGGWRDARRAAHAARVISGLTHHDRMAGDACVLWTHAIRRAVREGAVPALTDGLYLLPKSQRAFWEVKIKEAECREPWEFGRNGYAVTALQVAWSAITTPGTEDEPAEKLRQAVRAGHDTDTVAAIAGALVGAAYGESALPAEWVSAVNGWPAMDAGTLGDLAEMVADAR